MSLFYATLATGLFLILCGGSLLFNYNHSRTFLKAFPRSKSATYILMVLAMIWFSLKIYNLGIADFGDYKILLLATPRTLCNWRKDKNKDILTIASFLQKTLC